MTARRDAQVDDGGFTLVEITVGMVIMTIFMSIFTGAMVSMLHSVDRTQNSAAAQAEVNQVVSKLDAGTPETSTGIVARIRDASGISVPASNVFSSGDAVVEFVDDSSGPTVCTELRMTPGGTLQQRSWVQPQNGAAFTIGAATVLGTGLKTETPRAVADTNTTVAGPFARTVPSDGNSGTQQLEIAYSASAASQANVTNRIRHVDVTFAALDTNNATTSDTACGAARDGAYPWPAG